MSSKSLVSKFASRYGVDADKMLNTLKATAFRQRDGAIPTNEQMMALMIVADQYGLNPFTKEIYAFPDKSAGIIPVVGVDGWSRIINTHINFDGVEFRYAEEEIELPGMKHPAPAWCECVIYRKDREHPTVVREYLDEVYREPFTGTGKNGPYSVNGPWQSHTRRFLRHKALIQAARLAFGFVGIYDQDEADRILEGEAQVVEKPAVAPPQRKSEALPEVLEGDYTAAPLLAASQIAVIRAKLKAGRVEEDALLEAFEADSLDAIPASQVNSVLDWIQGEMA